MTKSRCCFSGWKIRVYKMRTAASHLCCPLPCHHLLFSTSHHLTDYSVSAEAVQLSLYSKNQSRNKTSQASMRGSLCARQQSSTSHLGQPASASGDFPQHSNKMSGPSKFTNSSRAEPRGSEGNCALTVLHMDTWGLCLREKKSAIS